MKSQFYSDPYFDRAFQLRDTISFAEGDNFLFLMNNNKFFFEERNGGLELKLFSSTELYHFSEISYFLGKKGDMNLWCVELSDIDLTQVPICLGGGEFQDVRDVISRLDNQSGSLSAYAKGLANWNTFQAYCSICGSKTEGMQYGHSRKCSSELCANLFFPKIAPAVIVLIEHKPVHGPAMCLLHRRKTDQGFRCSPFAGFVEVGESLEDAVIREMKEEVNVDVSNIRYTASQPWTFSSSLMIGFFAETKSISFQPDGVEIKDAKWYSAMEIKELVSNNELILSNEDSIARYLIQSWVENN